ncbi:CRAL-TRIO domain-containing protein [Cerioporus squamosus]|nr:CRAL-TRIO domain-containing protein [Cerioporus squamosus]
MSTEQSASTLPPGVTDPNYKPPPGRLGNLTPAQQEALDKLRKEIQDAGKFVPERHDDATLLRFLRARKFDVAAAKTMLLDAEQWRIDFGVDDLMKNFDFKEKALVDKYYPQYYHKTDKVSRPPLSYTSLRLLTLRSIPCRCPLRNRYCAVSSSTLPTHRYSRSRLPSAHTCFSRLSAYLPRTRSQEGRPVYIERLGLLDVKALYKITDPDRQLKRLVYEYEKFLNERLPACSKLVGHPVETSCTILDLYNVSLMAFFKVKDYVLAASRIGQDRYPETMGKFYIINAPWAFSGTWNIIKPWLDPATVAKIEILGGEKDYLPKLLDQIPAENLPKEFGGKCQCPGGCSMSDAGPWNPNAPSQ